jgi:hypothetical protein
VPADRLAPLNDLPHFKSLWLNGPVSAEKLARIEAAVSAVEVKVRTD